MATITKTPSGTWKTIIRKTGWPTSSKDFPYQTRRRRLEPTHGERFIALLQRHYPTWREARAELNELPLAPYR